MPRSDRRCEDYHERHHSQNGFFATNGGYEFNLALGGMALALLIVGGGACSIDGYLGIFW